MSLSNPLFFSCWIGKDFCEVSLEVFGLRGKNLNIVRVVIEFISVDVVNDFTLHQRSPQLLLSHYSVKVLLPDLRICFSVANSTKFISGIEVRSASLFFVTVETCIVAAYELSIVPLLQRSSGSRRSGCGLSTAAFTQHFHALAKSRRMTILSPSAVSSTHVEYDASIHACVIGTTSPSAE